MYNLNRQADTICRKGGEGKVNAADIGRRLVELRGNRTQDEVARSVGLSLSAIGMYERGERIPRDEIKMRLAKFYRKSVQEIFFD